MRIDLALDSIKEICGQPEVLGSASICNVTGLASLGEAVAGDLSFLSGKKYRKQVADSQASVILVPLDFAEEPNDGQLYFKVKDPSMSLTHICERVEKGYWPELTAGVHSSAVVADSASIAETAHVGPFCVIEEGVVIGENSKLQSHCVVGENSRIGADCWFRDGVTLYQDTIIRDRVSIHSGTVIGADGFGYAFDEGRHRKVPQLSYVQIDNDVEIGVNSSIDRGRIEPTLIGEGTKIDSMVQIGHNTKIGKHCILCAQVGIAGSTIVEDYVVFAGHSGAANHARIAKGTQIAGKSAALSDTKPGEILMGLPAYPVNQYMRIQVLMKKLPQLFSRVSDIEKQMKSD